MKISTRDADAAGPVLQPDSLSVPSTDPGDTDTAANHEPFASQSNGNGTPPGWWNADAMSAQVSLGASLAANSAPNPDALSLNNAAAAEVVANPVRIALQMPVHASSLNTGGAAASLAQAPANETALTAADPLYGAGVLNPFGLADAGNFASPALADIDGDGDLDAFVGNSDGNTLFFRNTGTISAPIFVRESGNFGLTDVGNFASPTMADIDGDGDLDAFVGEEQGSTVFFRNTGSASAPVFVRQASSLGLGDAGYIAHPTFADIDGDGDLDAFVGEQYGGTLFFRNTGSASAAVFVRQAGNFGLPDSGSYASPTLVDIDGDGDLDAFVGESYGNTLFFRNTGSATAAVFAPQSNPFGLTDVGSWASPTFADIDGDGDLDAFVGGADGKVRFFVNNAVALTVPGAISYTDTAFDDSFAAASRTLSARGNNGVLAMTYGISGGTDNGGTVSMSSAYGVLTVSKVTGVASFAPNDAAIEALGTATSVGFTLTASNGITTDSQTLTVNFAQSGITETPGNDTLTGTAGPDRIDALAGNDSLAGSGGNDTLIGGTGNDSLNGGAGNDSLTGGAGNDVYVVDSANDIVSETVTTVTETDSVSSSVSWTLGANLENLRLSGSSVINGTGNALANAITGNAANNQLSGAGGNDTLSGGGGDDSLYGGAGNDSYTVDSQTDLVSETGTGATEVDSVSSSVSWTLGANLETLTLTGSDALSGTGNGLANTITGNGGNNLLSGSGGHDTLRGADGNDTISGGDGNDLLDGGSGNDSLTGGAGNDSYVVQSSGDKTMEVSGGGTADSVSASLSWTLAAEVESLVLTGSSAINGNGNTLANTLTGNTAANTLSGGDGNDTISGGDGNDLLDGGSGNDSLTGGAGNDSYVVQSSGDKTMEVSGGGTADSVSASIGWTLATEVERLVLTGSSAINGTGNTLANTLTGNTAANTLSGGDGNDTISGGDGNDLLDGGSGNDSLTGGAGNDSYVVQSSGDKTMEVSGGGTADSVSASIGWTLATEVERLVLTGSSAINGTGNTLANTLTGNTAANTLSGGDGNDTISGGDGNDLLDGGSGNDSLTGGAGNDSYVVQSSGDKTMEVSGGGTADSVSASIGWTLAAEVERLVLTGSSAINGTGNTLANTITGNSGNNMLDGGAGNDTLAGGAGLDTFRFSSALNATGNVDTITAFVAADDSLQLENGVFLRLTPTGPLNPLFFHASSTGTAADPNDYINYELDTGKLFYDADGNGAGAPVLFATLTGAPAISDLDIFVT